MFNIYKASFDSRLFSIMLSCRCAHVSISDDSSSFVDIRLRWRNERTKLLTPPSAQITRRAAKGRTEIDLSSDSWLKIIKLLIDLLSLSLTRMEERIFFRLENYSKSEPIYHHLYSSIGGTHERWTRKFSGIYGNIVSYRRKYLQLMIIIKLSWASTQTFCCIKILGNWFMSWLSRPMRRSCRW